MAFDHDMIASMVEQTREQATDRAAVSPGAANYVSSHAGLRPRDLIDPTRSYDKDALVRGVLDRKRNIAMTQAQLSPRANGYVRMAGTEYDNPALKSVAKQAGSIPQISPASLTPGRIGAEVMDYRSGTSDVAQRLAKRFL